AGSRPSRRASGRRPRGRAGSRPGSPEGSAMAVARPFVNYRSLGGTSHRLYMTPQRRRRSRLIGAGIGAGLATAVGGTLAARGALGTVQDLQRLPGLARDVASAGRWGLRHRRLVTRGLLGRGKQMLGAFRLGRRAVGLKGGAKAALAMANRAGVRRGLLR